MAETIVFSIYCLPDDDKHWAHYVGLFTSPDDANDLIPASGKSHNTDPDGCVWYYSVWAFDIYNIPQYITANVPSTFPYREWR